MKMDIFQPKSILNSDGNWSPFFISSDAQEACHTIGKGICHHFLEHKSDYSRPVTVQYRSATLTCSENDLMLRGDGASLT